MGSSEILINTGGLGFDFIRICCQFNSNAWIFRLPEIGDRDYSKQELAILCWFDPTSIGSSILCTAALYASKCRDQLWFHRLLYHGPVLPEYQEINAQNSISFQSAIQNLFSPLLQSVCVVIFISKQYCVEGNPDILFWKLCNKVPSEKNHKWVILVHVFVGTVLQYHW